MGVIKTGIEGMGVEVSEVVAGEPFKGFGQRGCRSDEF
jgi:hypothetical protein